MKSPSDSRLNQHTAWSLAGRAEWLGFLTQWLAECSRRLVLLIGVLLLCPASPLSAQDDELTLGATAGASSRYVRRGVERSSAAWQTAFDGAYSGWRGRLWFTQPVDSANQQELQSSLGYVWPTKRALAIEASGTHFWYVDTPLKGGAAHSFEAAVRLNWRATQAVRPSLEFAYDIRYRSRVVEASLAYDLALLDWGTFLEWRAYLGSLAAEDVLPDATSGGVRDSYTYYGLDVRLPYRVSWHTTVAAQASIAGTTNQASEWSPIGRGSGMRGWVSISVIFAF